MRYLYVVCLLMLSSAAYAIQACMYRTYTYSFNPDCSQQFGNIDSGCINPGVPSCGSQNHRSGCAFAFCQVGVDTSLIFMDQSCTIGPCCGNGDASQCGANGKDCNTCPQDCGSCVVPPIVVAPPPIGTCGANIICGQITSFENPAVDLVNIVVELRDASGRYSKSATTDVNGTYVIPTAVAGYVSPAAGRLWNPIPNQYHAQVGDRKDFRIMFVPSHIAISGLPGSLVLLTTGAVSGAPPSTGPPYSTIDISATINLDGNAILDAKPGIAYWLTCWTYDTNLKQYVNPGSVQVVGTPANAQVTLKQACP